MISKTKFKEDIELPNIVLHAINYAQLLISGYQGPEP